MTLGLSNVCSPFGVIAYGIDAEADDFAGALGKFRLELGHVAEFGGADGGKIFGMREEDGPAIANPFVKMDRALGGFSGEIGGFVVDAQTHDSSFS